MPGANVAGILLFVRHLVFNLIKSFAYRIPDRVPEFIFSLSEIL